MCITPTAAVVSFYRRSCLSSHGDDTTACVCVKFSNLRYTPLHMAVLYGCQYRWPRGLLKDCQPLQGCGSTRQRVSYSDMVEAAKDWLPIARILVDAGADVAREDSRGRTPLSLLQAALAAADASSRYESAAAAELGVDDGCQGLLAALRGWEDYFLGQ
jgi:hypothetical protein